MMYKKTLLALAFLLFTILTGYSQEVISDFDEDSIPVLNEELRDTRRKISSISGDATRTLMWYVAGDLETGTNSSAYIIVPFTGTITKAEAYCKTAPTGAAIIVDVNLNGTTLWASGKLTIAAAANTGSKTSFDTTAVSAEDYFTIDIDQIGSGTAGADLTVMLRMTETLESRR